MVLSRVQKLKKRIKSFLGKGFKMSFVSSEKLLHAQLPILFQSLNKSIVNL